MSNRKRISGELLEDTELIQSTLRGNAHAFRILVEKYEPQVARTIIGMMGKIPEAEDVGQMTFIQLHRSLNRFKGESSLGTYITRIALNLSLNALKKIKRERSRKEELTGSHSISDDEVSWEEKRALQKAILALELKFRSVIVLRFFQGHSINEVAEILNIPMGTVLSRLSRAQSKLRHFLTPTKEVQYG